MLRRTAVGLTLGFLLAAMVFGGVLAAENKGGMTKVGSMVSTCYIDLPGETGGETVSFNISSVKVTSIEQYVDELKIDDEVIEVGKRMDNFVRALETGGAATTIVIFASTKDMPLTEEMWVPAEINGSFNMKGFSCDFVFSTVAHLKEGFDISNFVVEVGDNDKSGVGEELGELTNVESDDIQTKRQVYAIEVGQSNVAVNQRMGRAELTGTSTLYFME
jgi:hypothetical protein